MDKTAPTPAIVDVTDKFDDVNDYDRIYRSEAGYLVKVRTDHLDDVPGRFLFLISGAWCDDETAKARPHGEGHFVLDHHSGTGHALTVQHEGPITLDDGTPIDLAGKLEESRHKMVRLVERAALHHQAASAPEIKGVRYGRSPEHFRAPVHVHVAAAIVPQIPDEEPSHD